MAPFKSNDHWAFLEEIEAPMWIDLTLEGKSNYQNIDHKWFDAHHPVHQCSSNDLKAAFSQFFEDRSPILSDSVSRSRGKDYDSKKWRGNCQDFAIDKHVISEKLNSGSATKLKLRSSFTDSKGTSSSKSSLKENSMPNSSNSLSNHRDLAIGSSSQRKQLADSRSSSTITTDTSHVPHHKLMEVTSQSSGAASSLLLVMRRSLRKSCVTRQASRVEVNNSQRGSSGHKSSSSKSSVCSSSNPRWGVKSNTSDSEQHLKKMRDDKSFSRMTQAAMNKTKHSSVSSTLPVQVENASSNSRTVGKFYNAKSGNLVASKPKMVRAKASLLQKRDEQNVCSKPKKQVDMAGTGGSRTAVSGKENAVGRIARKENAVGRIAVSQKSDGRDRCAVSKVKDQRTQYNVQQRVEKQSVASSKVRNCHPGEGRNPGNANQRVYLR